MGATALMDYRFMDRHERMELVRDGDFARYFNLLELSTMEGERIARCLMYAAYLHGCVIIGRVGYDKQWWFLHRSWKYSNDLQLTTWDDYGPVGDVRVRNESDIMHLMTGRIVAGIQETC